MVDGSSDRRVTRERLVEVAARLFHEQGYAATGVATILREAEANPGSFYHFFPGKADLLAAVLEWYESNLDAIVLDPIVAGQPDPIERVFDLLGWYRSLMVETGCTLGCPIGNLALEVSDSHPSVRPGIHRNFAQWAAGIRGWLEEAGDRLPADCDRDALSHFILTVMEGGLMQSRASGDLAPFDAGVVVLRDYVDRLCAQRA